MTEPAELCLRLRFFTAEQGGRAVLPNLAGGVYRPHLVIEEDPEAQYLGIQVIFALEAIRFGEEVEVIACLPYPKVDYSGLIKGVMFKIMEGARCVGEGCVI